MNLTACLVVMSAHTTQAHQTKTPAQHTATRDSKQCTEMSLTLGDCSLHNCTASALDAGSCDQSAVHVGRPQDN